MKQVSDPLTIAPSTRPHLSTGIGECLNHRTGQRGAALIISLVILVSMTLLGITTMKSATTEFTMVGNLREAAITFQAAELALTTAERSVEENGIPSNTLTESDIEPNYLDASSWSGASVTKVTGFELANIPDDNNPGYIIKSVGRYDPNLDIQGTLGFGGTDSVAVWQRIDYYRITARGLGQTGNTSRTVQSFYGIELETN